MRYVLGSVLAFSLWIGTGGVAAADRDCGDFTRQGQAQSAYDSSAFDTDNLDGDGDGTACESLPGGGWGGFSESGADAPRPPALEAFRDFDGSWADSLLARHAADDQHSAAASSAPVSDQALRRAVKASALRPGPAYPLDRTRARRAARDRSATQPDVNVDEASTTAPLPAFTVPPNDATTGDDAGWIVVGLIALGGVTVAARRFG